MGIVGVDISEWGSVEKQDAYPDGIKKKKRIFV